MGLYINLFLGAISVLIAGQGHNFWVNVVINMWKTIDVSAENDLEKGGPFVHIYNVGPLFTIAKLVQITSMTRLYDIYNYS